MDKRYTVFVSSTYLDMKDHRDAVIQAIMRAGHIPLGMEAFGAADASQWDIITKTIDSSDYYILLIARRYGSVNTKTKLGFTEMEFDYALEKGIPCLVFQLEDTADWPGNFTDTETKSVKRLKAFRVKASTNRMISFWSNKHDLPFKAITALSNAFSDSPRDGWVRHSGGTGLAIAEELTRLGKKNAELENILASVNQNDEYNNIIKLFTDKKHSYESNESNYMIFFNVITAMMVSGPTDEYDVKTSLAKIYNTKREQDFDALMKQFIEITSKLGLIQFDNYRLSNGMTQTIYNLTEFGKSFSRYIILRGENV